MGYDKQKPRNNVILITAVGSALTLAGLVPVFHAYYDSMIFGEFDEKVEERDTGIAQMIGDSQAEIDGASVSLFDSMERVAAGQRPAPQPTDGLTLTEEEALGSLGALKGWSGRERIRQEAAAREAMLEARAAEQARLEAEAAAAAAATEGGDTAAAPGAAPGVAPGVAPRLAPRILPARPRLGPQ